MNVPRIVNDGDFNKEHQVGSDEWKLPFVSVGDNISFELKRKYRVDYRHYRPWQRMAKIATLRGTAYLIDESDAQDIGCGLLEYSRTFASLPVTRNEGTSIVYPIQYLIRPFPASPYVSEIPLIVSAEKRFEYFTYKPEPQIAPKVAVINELVYIYGGWGTMVNGKQYLANDSTVKIYKAGIYVREGTYITWKYTQ